MSSRDTESVPSRGSLFAGLAVVSIPFLLYAVIALATSVNIPYQDDFDSIGVFVEHFAELHGVWAKLAWIITAQHVQYKLIFLQTVAALQYLLTGSTNYRVLQLLGDLSMPAIVLVLWLVFARSRRPLSQRLWLFTPVPCLVLAIRYSDSVNWAMSGLQNMAVITLAVATLYFATQNRRHSFEATIAFLVLTICASGNGFFLSAVLLYLLVAERRYRHAAAAASVTAVMAAIYAIHYRVYNVQAPISLAESVRSIALYPFAFMGNAAGSLTYAVVLGLVLTAGFVFITARGWRRTCPASFGSALFCFVTAAAVTATRYRYGPAGALYSHYVMYSVLLIALEYIAAVRLFVSPVVSLRSREGIALAAAAVLSFAFCLSADAQGYRNLHARKRQLIAHLILWERHPDHLVLVPDEVMFTPEPDWVPLRTAFQNILEREISKGLYIPPYAAGDPLPVRPHSPATIGIEDEAPPAAGQ